MRSRERRLVETEIAVVCFEDRGRGHSQGMQVDGKSPETDFPLKSPEESQLC